METYWGSGHSDFSCSEMKVRLRLSSGKRNQRIISYITLWWCYKSRNVQQVIQFSGQTFSYEGPNNTHKIIMTHSKLLNTLNKHNMKSAALYNLKPRTASQYWQVVVGLEFNSAPINNPDRPEMTCWKWHLFNTKHFLYSFISTELRRCRSTSHKHNGSLSKYEVRFAGPDKNSL